MNANWTRREVLSGLGAAAALGPVAGRWALGAESSGESGEEGGRWRIGACDWSIGRRQQFEAMDLAAEIGLDGVQVSFDDEGEPTDLRKPEARERYAQLSRERGVDVSSLAMGVLNGVPFATEDVAERWVGECIEVMPKMEQRIVLLAFFGAGDINGDRALQDKVVERLKRLAPRAEQQGVVLGLETWMNADDHKRVVDAVGSEAVKVYYDVANMEHQGYDVPAEIRQLGSDYICEFHMKENHGLLGQGTVAFEPLRDAIVDIGYEGWLVIEGATEQGRSVKDCYVDNARFLRELFELA